MATWRQAASTSYISVGVKKMALVQKAKEISSRS